MKARGMGSCFKRGGVWWLRLHSGGRKVRLSTGVSILPSHKGPPAEVRKIWTQKLLELGRGGIEAGKVTFDDMANNLVNRYTAEGRTVTLRSLKNRLKHLSRTYSGRRVETMTEESLLAYAVRRREGGAAVATINLELAYVRRMLSLMRRRIPNPPRVPHLPGENRRQGTIPQQHFDQITRKLRWDYRALALFLRLTGWRRGEGIGLEWRRVDWEAKKITLDTSKNGKPRFLAFGQYHELHALLRLQRRRTKGSLVFPRQDGQPIDHRRFLAAWDVARKACGFSYLIHDLRRTRVAQMDRAGVPANIGMSSVGMSPAIYNRYGAVSVAAQEEWMGRAEKRP